MSTISQNYKFSDHGYHKPTDFAKPKFVVLWGKMTP
jgi:hypothetical protein